MPEVISTTVYRIHELPEGAKDRARAWYRDGGFDHLSNGCGFTPLPRYILRLEPVEGEARVVSLVLFGTQDGKSESVSES